MRTVYCRPWVFLKLLGLWILSVVISIMVLLHFRAFSPINSRYHDDQFPTRTAPKKQDLVLEAERLIKIQRHHSANFEKLLKPTNRSLEDLQFFPKLDQAKILDAALVNRPELKNFLKRQFNLTDKNVKVGPLEPLMMPKPLEKEINLEAKQHSFRYTVNIHDKCSTQSPFVLIFVHSTWSHSAQRDLIRLTWAKVTSYRGHKVKVIFVLAEPDPNLGQIDRIKAMTSIKGERNVYDDIIQVDFVDNYRNLTLKHLAAYHWILTYCPKAKYVVKVDDDTLVNTCRLVAFLNSDHNPVQWTKDKIYCSAFINQGPRRDPKDKWYVSAQEYPGKKYPTYCEGFAYVTTPYVLLKLYNASLDTPQYWIDDVYITGILAKIAHVRHKQFRDPNGYNVMHSSSLENFREVAQHALFVLAKYKMEPDVWKQLWTVTMETVQQKDYSINSKYDNMRVHMPHLTL